MISAIPYVLNGLIIILQGMMFFVLGGMRQNIRDCNFKIDRHIDLHLKEKA